MWDLRRSVIEPMSPTLAGEFLTTGPPGKPYLISSWMESFFFFSWQFIHLQALIQWTSLTYVCWDSCWAKDVMVAVARGKQTSGGQVLVTVVGFRLGIRESPSPGAVCCAGCSGGQVQSTLSGQPSNRTAVKLSVCSSCWHCIVQRPCRTTAAAWASVDTGMWCKN